jgi:hypothetical protein
MVAKPSLADQVVDSQNPVFFPWFPLPTSGNPGQSPKIPPSPGHNFRLIKESGRMVFGSG